MPRKRRQSTRKKSFFDIKLSYIVGSLAYKTRRLRPRKRGGR
jgi:hypothetical protein